MLIGNLAKAPVQKLYYTTGVGPIWQKSSGLIAAQFILIGGGGAGGSHTANTFRAGGGGGAGAVTWTQILPASQLPSGVIALTVGAGGTAAAGTTGNSGGTTSLDLGSGFGSYQAVGGSGGQGNFTQGTGGAGGVSEDITLSKHALAVAGGAGFCGYSDGVRSFGGNGGINCFSGSALGYAGNANGEVGMRFGGGGSGASNVSAVARNGGPGADGAIIVLEWY